MQKLHFLYTAFRISFSNPASMCSASCIPPLNVGGITRRSLFLAIQRGGNAPVQAFEPLYNSSKSWRRSYGLVELIRVKMKWNNRSLYDLAESLDSLAYSGEVLQVNVCITLFTLWLVDEPCTSPPESVGWFSFKPSSSMELWSSSGVWSDINFWSLLC